MWRLDKAASFWQNRHYNNNYIWELAMDNKIVAIILSILLPPIAVFLKKGVGSDLIINIVLCLLMWVPGVIHALWVNLK